MTGVRPGDGKGGGGNDRFRSYLRYIHLGTQMALTLCAGIFGGLWLDRWLNATPVFTVAGSLLGVGLGMGVVILAAGKDRR